MDSHTKQGILHNTVFIFLTKLVDIAAGFATVVLLARFLNPGGFGTYSFVITIFLVAQPLVNLELDKLVIRELSTAVSPGKIINQVYTFKSLLIVLFLPLGLAVLFWPGFSHLARALFLCLAAEVLIQYNLLHSGLFIYFHKTLYDTRANACAKMFYIVYLAGCWFFHLSLDAVFLGYLMSHAIRFAITRRRVQALAGPLRFSLSKQKALYLFKEALPLTMAAFFIGLTFRIDIFFLKLFAGMPAVGLFQSVHRYILIIQIVPVAVTQAIFPSLSRMSAEHSSRLYGRVFFLLNACASAVVMINLMFHEPLVLLLFGPAYSPAYQALIILAPVSIFLFLDYLNTLALTALKRQRFLVISGSAALVCNTLLDYLLIPTLGLSGAAIGTLSGYCLLFVISFWCLPRALHPLARDKRFWLNALLLLLLMLALAMGYNPSWPLRVAITAGYMAVLFFTSRTAQLLSELRLLWRARREDRS